MATTLTISVGFDSRRPAGSTWLRICTCSAPPVSREQARSSRSIQRRAAPMPRVSDAVSEAVCRVPKSTSVRMRCSMRCAEISASTADTIGSSAWAWAVAAVASVAAAARRRRVEGSMEDSGIGWPRIPA